MEINILFSNRYFNNSPSWQIVYEWEDIFISILNIELQPVDIDYFITKKPPFINRCLNKINITYYTEKFKDLFRDKKFGLVFMITCPGKYNSLISGNKIPYIIDLWGHEIDTFIQAFNETKLVYVGSLEAYHEIKKKSSKINVKYLPVSISDTYKRSTVPIKDIDIIQYGRPNITINNYIKKFLDKYPNYEYVYSETKNGKRYYVSSLKGILGVYDTRDSFNELLSRCKVSLVSSPGLDNLRVTGGFSPVTPRFFESAVNFCYMLGVYPDNPDYNYCNISSVCKNINSYEMFEQELLNMLKTPFNKIKLYNDFLENNYTSIRVKQIINDIKKLNK